MTIDVHTHLWPASETPPDLMRYFEKRNVSARVGDLFSCERLLELMEKSHIERSIVSAIPLCHGMRNSDLEHFNGYVLGEIKRSAGKLTAFCSVDPFGGEESIGTIKRCIEELGFRGLKLHPVIQQFFPNDRRMYGIYRTMQEYGLPILFHSGGVGIVPFKDSFGQPRLLDDVACDFPDLPIILGHGGRIWYDETAMLLRKHKNVYADISTNFGRSEESRSAPLEWLLYRIKVWAGGLERVFFGSDYPFYFQAETLEALQGAKESLSGKMRNFVTDADIEDITSSNPKRFLRMYHV